MKQYLAMMIIICISLPAYAVRVHSCSKRNKTLSKHYLGLDNAQNTVYMSTTPFENLAGLNASTPSRRVSAAQDIKWTSDDLDVGGIQVRIKLVKSFELPPTSQSGVEVLPPSYPLSIVAHALNDFPPNTALRYDVTHDETAQTFRVAITKVRMLRNQNLILNRYDYIADFEEVQTVHIGYLKPGQNKAILGFQADLKPYVNKVMNSIKTMSKEDFVQKFDDQFQLDSPKKVCSKSRCVEEDCSICYSKKSRYFVYGEKDKVTRVYESMCKSCLEEFISTSRRNPNYAPTQTTFDENDGFRMKSTVSRQMSRVVLVKGTEEEESDADSSTDPQ